MARVFNEAFHALPQTGGAAATASARGQGQPRARTAILLLLLSALALASPARTAAQGGAPDGLAHAPPLQLSQDESLWAALAFEDAPRLDRLLRDGASPDKPEALSMMTPLMAVETAPLAEALIAAGASLNARDRSGRTPLHHAIRAREALAIIPLLVRAGADLNARAEGGKGPTPLMTAIEAYFEDPDKERSLQIIRMLVDAGARVDEADGRGDTPLALAVINEAHDLAALLLDLGADPTRRLDDGKTAADYARDRGCLEMVALLDQAANRRTRE